MISSAEQKTRHVLQRVGFFAGPLLFAGLLLFLEPPPSHPQVPAMAAVAALMAAWWLTEAVPLAATALLPIVLFPLLGLADPARTTGQYFNPTITLFLGGFLIALAMERWQLHRRIALVVVTRIGSTPSRLVLGFLLASALLSMWISNTATATMMLPIGLAVVQRVEDAAGEQRAHPLSIALMLAIAYGASLGGVATLVGTPPNLALVAIYRDTFPGAPAISFGQWMLVGLPYAALALAGTWVVLTRGLWRPDPAVRLDRGALRAELAALGPMSREEKSVLGVFFAAALLWTFRQDLAVGGVTLPGWAGLWAPLKNVEDGTVAIALAFALFLWPAGRGPDGERRQLLDTSIFLKVPWDILLLFGGGFALAAGFTWSGLSAHLAGVFQGLAGMPAWMTIILVSLVITFLTELTSNTATAQMFLPVIAAWAVANHIHPLLVMVPTALSASMAFMLPVATPPNAIVFGSRRVHIAEMARTGLVLNLLCVVLTTLVCVWLLPHAFGFDPAEFPRWAAPAGH
ncbi:MAG TPA: SLC13 family permease [Opitutaceae bacterium]